MQGNQVGGMFASGIAALFVIVGGYWIVMPAMLGCGTQRYAVNSNMENLQDWSRFVGANGCRIMGELQVAFPKAGGMAGKIAGTGGYNAAAPLPTGNKGGAPNAEILYPNPNDQNRPNMLNPFGWFLPQSNGQLAPQQSIPLSPQYQPMPTTVQSGVIPVQAGQVMPSGQVRFVQVGTTVQPLSR